MRRARVYLCTHYGRVDICGSTRSIARGKGFSKKVPQGKKFAYVYESDIVVHTNLRMGIQVYFIFNTFLGICISTGNGTFVFCMIIWKI